MPNEFDTNKNQLDLFSYAESKQNQQDKRQNLASSGFTATVWTLSGVVLAACSLFEDDEGLGGGSVSVNASPVRDARLYFDIDGDGDVDEEDVRIQNEQYPNGFTTGADGRATGIPIELLGRPYIADLNGATDAATEHPLEGQYHSLQDEDGNHLIASPITDLINERATGGTSVNDVVGELLTQGANTPADAEVKAFLEELGTTTSYFPGGSQRVIALSKYLAHNQIREVVGREDTTAEQIAESQRIIGAVESGLGGSDAIVVLNEDTDTTTPDVVEVEITIGEHDSYVGIINAFAQDGSPLTYTLTNQDGTATDAYTIDDRGGIRVADDSVTPTNMNGTFRVRIEHSSGDPSAIRTVEVTIIVDTTVHELTLPTVDGVPVDMGSVEENILGSDADPLITGIGIDVSTGVTAADFEIRDNALGVFADKFQIEQNGADPTEWNLVLKDGEWLDYEAIPRPDNGEIELDISVANTNGDHSNTLTVTIMVGNVDDISFSGTLRANLREDVDVQANDELIAEGEVTIANNLDANGNPLPVVLSSTLSSGPATFTGDAAGVEMTQLDYGTFTYNHATNAWSYVVNNDLAAVQALKTGETLTEIVTLTIDDPDSTITHTRSITLNILGENEDVHYVDTITRNRVDGSDVSIEIGDPAIDGMLDLGNVFDGLTVQNQLAGSTPPTVTFAETDNADVLARQNLFTLTSDGALVFVGNDDDVANLLGQGIALDLVISAPDDTNEPIPFRLSINVVNEDDDGPAAYEIMGEVRENVALSVMRISDDPDTLRGTETYQWFLGDESNPVALLGTGPTYTVTAADLASGETIGVAVSYTDGSGTTYDGVGGNPNPIYAFASPVSFTSPAPGADRRIDLDEDTPANSTAHFTVQATSEDDAGAPVGIASYELLDENRDVVSEYKGFTINSSTGVITLTGSLDYEMDDVITLRVRATDENSPAETATLTLTVNVDDVNDNAPVFAQSLYTADIDETLGNGAEVARVSASDADGTTANNTVTYSINSGNTGNVFDIDDNGVITVLDANALDFETTETYTLIIMASDSVAGTNDATTNVVITVNDVNDIVPTYMVTAGENSASVRGTEAGGNSADVGTGYRITITDADTTNTFRGNFDVSDRRFDFVETSAGSGVWELTLLANEAVALSETALTLTYQVHDGTNTAAGGRGSVTVAVVDSTVTYTATQNAPLEIAEADNIDTTTLGTGGVLAQVTAESSESQTITYTLTSATDNNGSDVSSLFVVDSDDGEVRFANSTMNLDYEAVSEYSLVITASARQSATTMETDDVPTTVIIRVINEQEGDGTYIVEGNVAAGATLRAVVTDPDGTRSVTYEWYSLDSSGADRQVIAATQSIRLPGAADFDDTRTYHVTITHTDNLGHTPGPMTLQASAVVFDIQKTDNTAFPSSIAENTDSLPVVVATLDGDTRSPTYTFVGGDTITTSGVFTISQSGSTAGAITVNAPSDINFETAQEFNDGSRGYTLNVRATFAEDTANNLPEVTGDVVVTIIVTDENDNAPIFTPGQTVTAEIPESRTDADGTILTITASDLDGSDENKDLTYSIVSGNTGNAFIIDPSSGEIRVADGVDLNYDVTTADPTPTRSYTLMIGVTDGLDDTGATDTTADAMLEVTINITDVNDNDPVLGAPVWRSTYETSVPEDTGSGVHLFTVTATDADTATTPPPTLTYRIVTIDDVAYDSATAIFGINGSNGEVGIALDNALDRETKASHKIVIEAFDEGVRTSNQQTVIVTVGDVNEHKPVLGEPEWVSDYGDNGVPEDAYTGAPLQIFTATATDRDATNNGFSYEIVSVDGVTYDSSTSIFAIRAGRVGITSALDYATAPEIMDDTNTVIGRGHEIVIVAIDNSGTGMRSEPGTITVLVANRDDGPAVFEVSPTQANKDILEVEVDTADPDGLNGTYSYQWFTTTDDGVTQTDITGENGRRFDTSGRTDPTGTVYGVRVEYTDNAGTRYTKDGAGDDEVAPFAVNTTLRFTSSYSIMLDENDASPTLPTFELELNGVTVTGATYTFATDGNPGDFFALSSAGVLTLSSTYATSGVDFEAITDAQKSFRLLIMAEATSGETAVAPVTVTINDANDIVPVLSQSGTATPIAENDPGANTGITFTVADDDTVNTITYNVAATTSNANNDAIAALFEVDEASGMLRLAGNNVLDREHDALKASGQISLTITAHDGVRNSNSETVTITVNDVNDFDPVFRNGAEHTETISENLFTAGSTVVVSANPARDGDATADNRDLTYSIVSVSGSGSGLFNLTDPKTGRIVLTQALDYETAPLLPGGTTNRGYVIELLVVDQDGGQDTQTLTVVVTDEDDTDPEFGTLDWGGVGTGTAGATARTIDENTAGTLLTIPISDVDTAGGTLAVRIVSGNSVEGGEDLFVFAKNTANTEAELSINPNRVLNYEDGTTHTLVLEVSDGTRTATETVTITVNNINEETPTFTNDPIVTWVDGFKFGIIPEDTDVSGGRVLVGRVAISDDDGATNFLDERVITIAGAGTKFEIERNADVGTNGGTLGEGLIYLNAALDREGVGADDAEYDAVKITVTDGSLPAVTSDAFSIFIDDINEGDPVIAVSGSPASFTERTASGNEATGVTFTITDADTGSTYTSSEIALSGDSRFDFVWDEAMQSGTVVLKDTETLDHDAATNPDRAITLTLTVTDPLDASVTDTETITINVGNADDVASEFADFDVSYWQTGTGSGVTGEEHIRTINEDQGASPILAIPVSDPDTTTLTASIQGGSPMNSAGDPIFSFGILNNQAVLSVLSSRLDYETAPNTYTLVLEVSDGTNTPAATQTVVINVGNVNEHDPAFGAELVDFGTGFSNGIIPEDTAEGTVIGVVDVSDADGDVLTVTVLPDQGATQALADKFEVVYNMMDMQYELKLKTALDLEGATPDPSSAFGLRLRATDGTNSVESPADTGSLIVISIGNVDDADPVFNDTHITWNVGALNIRGVDSNTIAVFEYVVDGTTTSGAPAGRKLADLAASDPDTSGALAYSIDNGPQIGGVDIFEIGGANNDELLLKTALDYEAAEDLGGGNRGYTLTLTVSDGRMGVNPVSHEVTIRVLNADEGRAVFAPLTSSGDVTAPAVGDELTFTPTPTTADPDGNPVAPNTFTRTWYRENPDGTGLDTITNASDTYTITSADVGKIVGVIVNYIDGGGTEYLGTAGVRVELADVVVSDFTADAASLRGEVHQYDLAEASGTFTYDDMASTETKAKITAADTVTYAIKTGGESVHGTAAIDSSGAWTFDVNNAHADVLALNAGDADTTNDSLDTKFTVQVSVTTGGVTETFDQDVTVTINAATKISGTDAGDTINRSAATGYEFIQGGDLNDIITVGDHGSVVVGGYGKDQIMLGDGVDTVVHRFASLSTGGWRQDDGATIVRNFERGVDKLFLVDVDSASPVTLATFLDATKSGAATSAIEGQMLITLQIENNTELVGITFEITSSVRLDGPGGDSTDPAGTEMTIYFSEMIDLTDTDELAKFLGVGEADAGGAQGGYYDNAGGFTDFRTVPTFFSDTARQEVADTGSSDTFDVIALADLDFTIL